MRGFRECLPLERIAIRAKADGIELTSEILDLIAAGENLLRSQDIARIPKKA